MLDKIPEDILQMVIEQKSLNLRDLINLSSTCSYLRNFISQNNRLWKKEYLNMFSEIDNSFEINDYFAEFQHGYNIHRKVDEILINLATKFIDKEKLSDTDYNYEEIITSREYIENYLRKIFHDRSEINTHNVVPLKTPGNLTLKYYSLLSLYYLRHQELRREWIQFCVFKEENQLLEIGIVLLLQWIKPQYNVKIKNIRDLFDEMTEKIKKHLNTINPNNPLFKTNLNDLNLWRNKNIYENKFSWVHCEEILGAMKHVMFQVIDENEPDETIKYPFITDVLESKESDQISLAIVYESIARRLGIYLQLILVDSGCILKFVEIDTNNGKTHYVDVFEWTKVHFDSNLYKKFSPMTVIKQILNNIKLMLNGTRKSIEQRVLLMRSILELKKIVDSYDVDVRINLVSVYERPNDGTTHQKINIENLDQEKYIERPLDVKFAVGMIMEHNLYNYKCVIYNWGAFPKRIINNKDTALSKLFQAMRKNQPYYHVLLPDGSKKYVEQECLTFCGNDDGFDKNPEIGRFFTHFFKNSFVPNCVLNDKFPNDFEIRMKFC